MNKKALAGWILSALIALFLFAGGARGKFYELPEREERLAQIEGKERMVTTEVVAEYGIFEVVAVLLFLIPHTAFIGAILLSAYLGGAVATHDRIESWILPIAIGVLVWVALGLRDNRVFANAFSRPRPKGET